MFDIRSEYKFFTIIIIILLSSTYNLKAENNSIALPGWFMKNQGQFGNGSAYCLKSGESNTFFFDTYIVHQFISGGGKHDSATASILNLRIDFENCNPDAVFEERDVMKSKSNFFKGTDAVSWKTDIGSFGTLAYKELYKDIDLIYYNVTKGIKSDFIVHSGGKYSDIELCYSGVQEVSVNDRGMLQVCTAAGEITEHIPEAYQIIDGEKVPVKVNYRVKKHCKVSFDVEDYNPLYDLIIDPQLDYCSYFGGTGDDQFFYGNMVLDAQKNIYFAAKTRSFDFPVTSGSYSTSFNGMYDIVVVKLNPSATQLLFSTFIGGADDDCPYGIELSGNQDDIVVAGFSRGSGFPVTAGVYQDSYAGGTSDGFVLKLNNSGNTLIFSTYIGDDLEDYIQNMKVDASSNIFLGGYSNGNFPTTAGAYQAVNTSYEGYDFFVAKLNPTGTTLLASTMIGGSSYDRGMDIALDATGNIYISGSVEGPFPITVGAFDVTFNGGTKDMVVCKFDPGLTTLLYSTYLGGPGDDIPSSGGLIVDNLNQVTVTGKCESGFPTTNGSYNQTYAGGPHDAFLTRLNATFSALIFSTYIGGTGDDMGYSVCTDNNENLVITGLASSGFPVTPCAYDLTFNGGGDAFVSKFNRDASKLIYSTYLGGSDTDYGTAVLMNGDTAIITGDTKSSDLPLTANAYDPTSHGGGSDLFLAKILLTPDLPKAQFTNPDNSCINKTVTFSNTSISTTTFNWNFGDGIASNTVNPSHSFLKPGEYHVKLIASNSCSSDTVTGNLKISGFLGTNFAAICEGDSVLINGLYRKSAGIFEALFLSYAGCDSIIKTNLAVNPIQQIRLNPSICEGEKFTVGVNKYTTTGIFTDKLKTASGCDSIVITNLVVNPVKQAFQNPSICQGEIFQVGINKYTTGGRYTDLLKTSSGCDSIVITTLTVNPIPFVTLGNDTIICPGDLITLDPGRGFIRYKWSDGSELSNLQIIQPGKYSVNVFDGLCSASDTIYIDVCGAELWFPNVFTPNEDGKNDHFRPVINGVLRSYHILIFNRWGQQLYDSADALTGWDGKYKGNICPEGVYYFIAEYSTGMLPLTQKQSIKRGAVTLLR